MISNLDRSCSLSVFGGGLCSCDWGKQLGLPTNQPPSQSDSARDCYERCCSKPPFAELWLFIPEKGVYTVGRCSGAKKILMDGIKDAARDVFGNFPFLQSFSGSYC